MNPCVIEDCDKPVRGHGYCLTHYTRWRRHGDPNSVMSWDDRSTPVETRFWAKVDKTDTCWNWVGSKSSGYGTFNLARGRGYAYAHRFSYELLVGPVPEGLELDHLCRNPACVNPSHLEPVTGKVNSRRANRIGYHSNAPQTCKRGHDWSVTPPYIAHRSNGKVSRRCRVCQSEKDRARRGHHRAIVNPAEAIAAGVSESRLARPA